MVWLMLLTILLAKDETEQFPPIGIIDFYGLHNILEKQAREALLIKEGDPVPASFDETLKRLTSLPGVDEATVTPVCCDQGKSVLFFGIKEKGIFPPKFSPPPTGKVQLPPDIMAAGKAFEQALYEAILRGDSAEDASQGHALFHAPAVRTLQNRFIEFAGRDFELLRKVLHDSADGQQRALAAQILAYTKNKRAVVQDFVAAMRDSDENVRNNSMRSLARMAYAERLHKLNLKIPWQPFIEMLNSTVWTDRNKASAALLELTERRDPSLLFQLHQQAMGSLIEMARWNSKGHAYPGFFILGRIAGLSEEKINGAWELNDRESVIAAAQRKYAAK